MRQERVNASQIGQDAAGLGPLGNGQRISGIWIESGATIENDRDNTHSREEET